jgi:hypothetical protein
MDYLPTTVDRMRSRRAVPRSNGVSRISARIRASLMLASATLLASAAAFGDHPRRAAPDAWSEGQLVITGAGCPIETPDGLSLMIASGRAGGMGGTDIWTLDRPSKRGEWSEPKNLPQPVNSAAADFCPSPFDRSLFFVSTRADSGACGGGDIYLTHQSPAGDWSEPIHLPCAPDGPNTPGTERSPSLVRTWYGTFLFFSTNEGIAGADDDIYVSTMNDQGQFEQGVVVRALSTEGFQDQMPTVRARRDRRSYEVTFNSDRPSYAAQGGQDAYYAKAAFLPFWWSWPRNLGPKTGSGYTLVEVIFT